MAEKFVFFWQAKSPFCQWLPSSFTAKSVVEPERDAVNFTHAEQYMMAEKALLFEDERKYQDIMKAKTPRKQKELGREVKHFSNAMWKNGGKRSFWRGILPSFLKTNFSSKSFLTQEIKFW